jgi:hypothetical protein
MDKVILKEKTKTKKEKPKEEIRVPKATRLNT